MDPVSRESGMAEYEATWKKIGELEQQRMQLAQEIEKLVDYTILLERQYLL